MDKQYYGAIDGLRTIAAIGIVMMHIMANNSYILKGYFAETVIPSFTNFVFLFMVISAFSMSCGYHKKVLCSEVNISVFYQKRFSKVLPFFAVLVILDIIISPSLASLYEGFADVTLLFGLLQSKKSISVIGVGWFIGLVFVFYLIFPFFCYLTENKKRAWISFVISLIYNYACVHYFEVGRNNILYCACYFLAGGLVYLYREKIARLNKISVLLITYIVIAVHFMIGGNTVTWLSVSVMLVLYAILPGKGILNNAMTAFLGSISMEIYLSHMLIFRIIEKLGINTVLGNGWLQYVITVVLVLVGTIVFAIVVNKVLNGISGKLSYNKKIEV